MANDKTRDNEVCDVFNISGDSRVQLPYDKKRRKKSSSWQ